MASDGDESETELTFLNQSDSSLSDSDDDHLMVGTSSVTCDDDRFVIATLSVTCDDLRSSTDV